MWDPRPALAARVARAMPAARPLVGAWIVVHVLLVAVQAYHSYHYYPFLADDALISLRYSKRLCTGDGLTWTDGARVEGYTDLLWVLLNAPAACFGLSPIISARLLGGLGVVLALVAIAWPTPFRVPQALARLCSGGVLWVLLGPAAVWAVGGLEHGFMLGVLALALQLSRHDGPWPFAWLGPRRQVLAASGCFGALLLLRADGIVLLVAATAGRILGGLGRGGATMRRDLVAWLAIPLSLQLLQLAFRLLYYGAWVPNTAVAKVSFNWTRVARGADHVLQAAGPLSVLLVTALAGAALSFRRKMPARTTMPLVTALGWAAYVALVGGDIFPAWRQLSLALPPLALLVADGAEALVSRAALRAMPARLGLGAVWAVVAGLHLHLQISDPENARGVEERWEWDGRPLGLALKRTFGEAQPLLAVDAAGALPYWSELPALDMLGLNDAYIPRHPPPGFGLGPIGHELGNADYLWRRSPDLIAFCIFASRAPCYAGGRGVYDRREFRQRYQEVRVQAAPHGPVGHLYVKRTGKIGVRRTARGLSVPAYLLADGPSLVRPDPTGRLSLVVSPGRPAHIERLQVPAGTYRLGTTPGLARISVACDGISPAIMEGGDPRVVRLAVETRLSVVAGVAGGPPVTLRSLALSATDAVPGLVCTARSDTLPVRRKVAELSADAAEGSHWWQPGSVRVGRAGLRVALDPQWRSMGASLTILADGNDRYAIELVRGTRVIGRAVARSVGPGLRRRAVSLPRSAAEGDPDALQIKPLAGDGMYSVAHLTFER